MNEKEFRDALLKSDSPAPAGSDPRELTAKILQRDQRRLRLLKLLTLSFWVLTAIVIMFAVVAYFSVVAPRQTMLLNDIGQRRPPSSLEEIAPESQLQVMWVQLQMMQMGMKLGASIVIALSLAAISTVLLVFAARRATLRHVNASLVEISEQLKQLRAGLGK